MDLRLVSDIELAEGCRLGAYKDTLGNWTIGYGHLLKPNKDWTGHEITQEEANNLLKKDLENATVDARTLIEWAYLNTPCRQNAVIELVFNLGLNKWRGFALTRLWIQQQNWPKTRDELLNSLWAEEVGPIRSGRIAKYLLTGQYLS